MRAHVIAIAGGLDGVMTIELPEDMKGKPISFIKPNPAPGGQLASSFETVTYEPVLVRDAHGRDYHIYVEGGVDQERANTPPYRQGYEDGYADGVQAGRAENQYKRGDFPTPPRITQG